MSHDVEKAEAMEDLQHALVIGDAQREMSARARIRRLDAPDEPTEECIERVLREVPHFDRPRALDYIAAAHRGNLICLDCGSENHTRGNNLCNFGSRRFE